MLKTTGTKVDDKVQSNYNAVVDCVIIPLSLIKSTQLQRGKNWFRVKKILVGHVHKHEKCSLQKYPPIYSNDCLQPVFFTFYILFQPRHIGFLVLAFATAYLL